MRARTQLCLGCVAASATALAANDYRRWIELGPGGAPQNPAGWALVTALRMLKREPYSPEPYQALRGAPDDGRWLELPDERLGPRPRVDPHPIPQRQLDRDGEAQALALVQSAFETNVESRADLLCFQPSGLERHNQAITATDPKRVPSRLRIDGEIAHIHPTDGSMHMVFSPSDAATVVETGWGERHSLAGWGRLPLLPDDLLAALARRGARHHQAPGGLDPQHVCSCVTTDVTIRTIRRTSCSPQRSAAAASGLLRRHALDEAKPQAG